MNKKVAISILLVVVVAVTLLAVKATNKDSAKTDSTPQASETKQTNLKAACDIYTLDIAKKYLGESAKLGDTASSNSKTEGNDTIVSSCLYEDGAEISKIINIQLIAAKNDAGKSWNKNTYETSPKQTAEFAGEEPPVLEQVSGIGESAYWNPQMGQLCVLVDGGEYWLTVQGSIKDSEEQKNQHKAMAKDLVEKL